MTSLQLLPEAELTDDSPGVGVLTCQRGNLPLTAMTVDADITGLVAAMTIRQTFANPHDCPIEALYIFPLPDRAAVTGLSVTIGRRCITGVLKERQAARDAYTDAVAAGLRAALLEEDRPDVFTTSIGNLAPGEEATVELTVAGTVGCELGEATFRVPLVVAPRYIPGRELEGGSVGLGTAVDTDAVPDASRITPPLLLAGADNPVRLAVTVRLDPAGMRVSDLRSSLHAVAVAGELPAVVTVELQPGERLNRDFILRYRANSEGGDQVTAVAVPDPEPGSDEGTYIVTVLAPTTGSPAAARDVVVLLDRSGSMSGWKIVAARRAAARIVDSLTSADRFAVVAFDDRLDQPDGLPAGALVVASDRNRYRAVEWLSRLEARGGTELAAALTAAYKVVAQPGASESSRARCCVLVTDGQVGDEDRLVRLATEAGVRMFSVGIDQAVNAGLLGRLAGVTGGRCDLVESEDRLDDVLADLERRIGHPVLESVTVRFDQLAADGDTATPRRPPDLYPGVPLILSGRYRGRPDGRAMVTGRNGRTMSCQIGHSASPAGASVWARAHLRDLEDQYASGPPTAAGDHEGVAAKIVAVSLRHRVLCRFTAWVAVDHSGDLVEGTGHRIVQPVEMAAGWAGGATATNWMGSAVAVPAMPVGVAPSSPSQPQSAPGPRPPMRITAASKELASPRPVRPVRAVPTGRDGAVPTGRDGALAAGTPWPSPSPLQLRLIELLGAVERLGNPASGADHVPLAPAIDRSMLAAEARSLAGDFASLAGAGAVSGVWDVSALVEPLEALAAVLASGRAGAIRRATKRIRDLLSLAGCQAGPAVRPASRARSFWR